MSFYMVRNNDKKTSMALPWLIAEASTGVDPATKVEAYSAETMGKISGQSPAINFP